MKLLLKCDLSLTNHMLQLGPLCHHEAFRKFELRVHSHERMNAVPTRMAELS